MNCYFYHIRSILKWKLLSKQTLSWSLICLQISVPHNETDKVDRGGLDKMTLVEVYINLEVIKEIIVFLAHVLIELFLNRLVQGFV